LLRLQLQLLLPLFLYLLRRSKLNPLAVVDVEEGDAREVTDELLNLPDEAAPALLPLFKTLDDFFIASCYSWNFSNPLD